MSKVNHQIISSRFAIKGMALFLAIMSCVGFIIFKQIRNNRVLSNALIEHLRKLAIEKPNNPIFIFLLKNNATLIRNIEKSYIYDVIEIVFISISILAFVIIAMLLAYTVYKCYQDKKNNKEGDGAIDERVRNYNSNSILFGIAFFGSGVVLGIIGTLPLLFKTPDKLSQLLCSAITSENLHDNALLEVFKKIIQQTFHEETLILDIKSSIKNYVMIFTAINITLFAMFLIVAGVQYYRYLKYNDPEKQLNDSVTEKNNNNITNTPVTI